MLIFAIGSSAIAQTQPTEADAEKEKIKKETDEKILRMLDQVTGDAPGLRLAKNRAIVYGMAGDLYWKLDEKRAREMFRNAFAEILADNSETEKERIESSDQMYIVFGDFNPARNQILPLVAKHDAELALEMLVQSRPAKLAEAMLKAQQPAAKADAASIGFNMDSQRVRQEVALEQRFALLAADENPEKAIKLIKESIAKGISWNVMPLLQKLYKKDEKKAASLADDVIKKLVDSDLSKRQDDLQAALNFLQMATNPNTATAPKEKQFKFSDAQLKYLADKVADTFLQPSNSMNISMSFSRAMPALEKLVPERIAVLKQRQAALMKNMPPEVKNMQERQKLWDGNSTPEELIAEILKLTSEMDRTMAYQSLGSKIAGIDDDARAKKLIDQIPDEKHRERILEQFESSRITRSASAGKLDEARKMIGNLTKKKTQIQRLVALAMQFHRKNTEKDIETAKSLMKDAKALATEFPEDEDELYDLMEVVKGYAVVEPDLAFRLFEPIVDQINEVVQASSVLSKYNKRITSFKKGELVMTIAGNSQDELLIFRCITQLQMLGKADLARMNLLSDRFQRNDSRSIARLFVISGFLKDVKDFDAVTTGGGMTYISYY